MSVDTPQALSVAPPLHSPSTDASIRVVQGVGFLGPWATATLILSLKHGTMRLLLLLLHAPPPPPHLALITGAPTKVIDRTSVEEE